MKISSFVTKNDYDEDDKTFSFTFNFDNEGFRSQVILDEPYIIELHEWNSMIDEIKNYGTYHLSFYQGNGDGSMTCTDKEIIFNTTTSGAGGDTTVRVALSKDKYGQQILDCLTSLLNNEIVTNYFS